MSNLRQARQDWTEIEVIETQLLRHLTPEQGIQQYLALQREFEPQLQKTEGIFRQQRIHALTELQARLATLNHRNGAVIEDWLRQFEQALDDSTLIGEYRRLRKQLT